MQTAWCLISYMYYSLTLSFLNGELRKSIPSPYEHLGLCVSASLGHRIQTRRCRRGETSPAKGENLPSFQGMHLLFLHREAVLLLTVSREEAQLCKCVTKARFNRDRADASVCLIPLYQKTCKFYPELEEPLIQDG